MPDIKFTKEHEWIRIDGNVGTVGITDYAQEQLGDVVFVDLPETGKDLTQNAEAAVVESVKAASEIYAPVSGTVTETNQNLTSDPAKVNVDPTGDGWFFKLTLKNPEEAESLLDEAAYQAYIKELE